MEIEVNWRRFILIVLAIALVGGGAFVALPQLQNRNQADDELADLKATLVPERQKIVASDLKINFENRSSWQVEGVEECLPLLSAWLNGYPLETLSVVITDTVSPDMTLGVVQSGQNSPDAKVRGKCEDSTENELVCFMAVEQGEPSPNLDVAATMEIAWLVKDFYRPKTKDAWNRQAEKNVMADFQPLIKMENEEWKSNCLHLTR